MERVWLAVNGLTLVLLVVVVGGWLRVRPAYRRRTVAGLAAMALGVTLLLVLLPPARVPIGWITVLQEGRGLRNVQQLYGQGAHFGSGFSFVIELLSGHDATTLPAVVHLNLCLALVNTILFFLLARAVLPSWWASLGFTLGYVCNQNTLHAAFSELPAMLLTTHVWLACIVAAVIGDQHTPARLRWLALVCLALLVVLAGQLRSEFLVLGVPAVAVGVVMACGWDTHVRAAMRALGRVLRAICAGRLSIFLIVIAVLVGVQNLPWLGKFSYLLAALAPLNLSFLLLPQKLGVFLPFGFIILFVLGTVHALRHWLSFFLLPITLLTLYKLYATASQGVFESFRYLTFLTPLVFFLALFGFRELSDWAERWAWPPWWKRVAVLLLVVSMTAWQPMGPGEAFGRRQQLSGLAYAEPLLGRNQQTEVRYLLDLVARYPTCVFLVKTVRAMWPNDTRTGHQWVAFGSTIPHLQEMQQAGGSVEEAAQRLAPNAPCVLFYRSLDCDLAGADDCQAETQGRTALEERVLDNLPYNDINGYGGYRAEIRLGVYPVVPIPTASPSPGASR